MSLPPAYRVGLGLYEIDPETLGLRRQIWEILEPHLAAIADRHIADLDARIAQMQAMADTLRHLSHCCAGDDRPDCPILADLTQGAMPTERPKGERDRPRR